jgi:formylglycine-generating enzyme required for sulfatase activity
VGNLKPNDLGLFDMHGNAWCWCQDRNENYRLGKDQEPVEDMEGKLIVVSTETRILRGGSFLYLAPFVRSANRVSDVPTARNNDLGFRPARTLPLVLLTALPPTAEGGRK